MHGISKRKHEHLVEALLLLEQLLTNEQTSEEDVILTDGNDFPSDVIATKRAVEKARVELQEIFDLYTSSLNQLSILIGRYDELYNYSRTAYLAKVLKELRRTTNRDEGVFQSMRENIQAVYKT